ncbi:hypothetical protein [Nocardia flavorosea]|uniref:Uncharacterized protein n=1 Tax=Nocardia flavorosea TaxID=53429 RepID=A0A846YMT8_9NOCA|nr:hypothetical protein [Nocardia flavorosea]NKY60427.1 hypothetical protein [Nocardia flavorosea]
MTTPPGLEWLTVGATVAYVHNRRDSMIYEAVVQKVGKRDVVVTVNDREEKFNINKTTEIDGTRWLDRWISGTWGYSTSLGPLDSDHARKLREGKTRTEAITRAHSLADDFTRRRDVDTAKKLRDALDVFLELHDTEKD